MSSRSSIHRRGHRLHPAAAEALSLVITAIPLPTDTLKALRLTCRPTRRAVDTNIKEITLRFRVGSGLYPVGTPLASELASLKVKQRSKFTSLNAANACMIAMNSSKILERLCLPWCLVKDRTCRAVAGMLGSVDWPLLRSLTLRCLPNTFRTYIKIDAMPALTELVLYGSLGAADMNALRRGAHFSSTVKVLRLSFEPKHTQNDFNHSIGELLAATTRLRSLHIEDAVGDNLDFLAAAALPSLETLQLIPKRDFTNLYCITNHSRLQLRTLELYGGTATADHLEALVSNREALPVLENLVLALHLNTWTFMRQMQLANMKSFTLKSAPLDAAAVEAVAAALARLPLLEDLRLSPGFEEKNNTAMAIEESDAFDILLSGPPLPRLRRLETGDDWNDTDDSLRTLIKLSNKIPQLEELVLGCGRISATGFAELAEAGRGGAWPGLKLFEIREIDDNDEISYALKGSAPTFCRVVVQEVWPGLEVKIG